MGGEIGHYMEAVSSLRKQLDEAVERLAMHKAGMMVDGKIAPRVLDWWRMQEPEYRKRLRASARQILGLPTDTEGGE